MTGCTEIRGNEGWAAEMATIRDVARAAGVSIATVSATLNGTKNVSEELRKRVLDAVGHVGYAPNGIAQSLKRGTTRLLGLILPDITNPYFAALARAAESAASARGYTVLLCNTDEDAAKESEYLRLMKTQRVAGLILALTESAPEYTAGLVEMIAVPVVLVDRVAPGAPWDSVASLNADGARRAVTHLIERGHRRIGGVFGRDSVSPIQERLAGYRTALEAASLSFDPGLVRLGCRDSEAARKAAQALLNLPDRPTAFFTSNNQVMLGVLQAVRNHGLACPADVSITGFDGLSWAEVMNPPMTTVEQPAAMIGDQAVELLLRRLEGAADEPRHVRFPTEFLVRGSSAKPPPRLAQVVAGAGRRPAKPS